MLVIALNSRHIGGSIKSPIFWALDVIIVRFVLVEDLVSRVFCRGELLFEHGFRRLHFATLEAALCDIEILYF